jgi:hypothetical protein
MTNSDINKKRMIEALRKSLGVVKTACEVVDISRQTHYRWLEEDPEYKQCVDDIGEEAIDFAESKLFEKIEGITVSNGTDDEGKPKVYTVPPSDTAIIFYLKTKGKKRGYVERTEFAGVPDQPLSTKTDDELKLMLCELSAKLSPNTGKEGAD